MKFDIGVIGLGYVGLTLATALSKCGLKVLGVDKKQDIVSLVNSGRANFIEPGLDQMIKDQVNTGNLIAKNKFDPNDDCKYFVITVGTPLDDDGKPRLDMIKTSVLDISKQMRDGSTIIVRSTVEIGTTRNLVEKELKKTKKKFFLAMCAERTIEGNAMKELKVLPQIIGSDDIEASKKAAKIFKLLTNTIIFVNTYESAEIIKLVDNTFRDVQFAFANEVARICDAVGVNAIEVINAGKQNYPRTNVALPGLVGGPCLVKDPHILVNSAKKYGIDLEITKAARFVNEHQPIEIISKLIDSCCVKKLKKDLKISILGMAFKGKPPTNDLRGSKGTVILQEFKNRLPEACIGVFDPIVSNHDLKIEYPDTLIYENIYDAANQCDLVIIANNNDYFRSQDLNKLINYLSVDGFIFDFWNNFNIKNIDQHKQKYLSLGNMNI